MTEEELDNGNRGSLLVGRHSRDATLSQRARVPGPVDTIATIEPSLTITDEASGIVLRPSPERLRRELKRQGVTHRRRAIRMLAEQAREAGDERRAAYLAAWRFGLTGRIK